MKKETTEVTDLAENENQKQELDKDVLDENVLILQRRSKLAELRARGNPFPNDFRPNALAFDLHQKYDGLEKENLEKENVSVSVAGRIMLRRVMGKASFITVQDRSSGVQAYLRAQDLPEGVYDDFKSWDLGDIVGVEGVLFKTKTGELSIRASQVRLLTKSLRPLPDKFHGLSDKELRYRQRYLDLLVNERTRLTFKMRSKIINAIRDFLIERDFLEVETPMMQPIPGGAAARPFVTWHNALDMELFLRIAPELYLKRLIVGGFERVFEINRNFRNEGLSIQHNPEFTMLEFYQAYADYNDLMDLTESLFQYLGEHVLGSNKLHYQGHDFDLSKAFVRMTMKESILHHNKNISAADLEDMNKLQQIAERLEIPVRETYGAGKIQLEIFEKTVEDKLLQPTFITAYPAEVSPLARRNDEDPSITDRFELFVGGREIANGFSELNDPEDQAERFMEQVKEKEAGDIEAMHYDVDFVTALEHGMPPTAGEGIGIDRLVMLFTDMPSIRDVVLFPQLKHKD